MILSLLFVYMTSSFPLSVSLLFLCVFNLCQNQVGALRVSEGIQSKVSAKKQSNVAALADDISDDEDE